MRCPIPQNSPTHFEHSLVLLVRQIQAKGPHVAVVSQQSLRRQSQKALWAQQWNRLKDKPLELAQVCSCQLGSAHRGCHLPIILGTTYPTEHENCTALPSGGCTSETAVEVLTEALNFLCSLAPTLTHGCEWGPASASTPRPPGPSSDESGLGSGSQRVPISAPLTAVTGEAPPLTAATSDELDGDTQKVCLPTAAKVREKARRKAQKDACKEHVVQKRKFHIEDHHDDCGEDLSSLEEAFPIDVGNVEPINVSKVKFPLPGAVPLAYPDPRAVAPGWRKTTTCAGCKWNRPPTHWHHTREIGQCAWPGTQPIIPTCPGCIVDFGRTHHSHTFRHSDNCRFAAQPDQGHPRQAKPHDPRPKPRSSPTANLPGTLEGRELGADAEAEASKPEHNLPPPDIEDGQPDGDPQMAEPGDVAEDAKRRGRGPDKVSRHVRTFRDAGGQPENPDDWSNFDIGKVVRLFRTNNPEANQLTLTKLHIRWWHAAEHVMKRFLERVGVPDDVLALIPATVNTCKVCREWARPGPGNVCSVDIPDTFNQQVECDLLFVEKKIIFHMIDRCTRWHATRLIPDKEAETLLCAIDELWISVHGAPKELLVDGESGIVASAATTQYLVRKGTKLRTRAKDQHAKYIERRGALLRDAIHKIQSQLKEEGLEDMSFTAILAEATFAGNALLTINGSTPYNAVYGRVPRILPGIDQVDYQVEGDTPKPGPQASGD